MSLPTCPWYKPIGVPIVAGSPDGFGNVEPFEEFPFEEWLVVRRVDTFDYLRFDLERGNMRHMTGEWHLADLGEGTRVTCKAVIVPSFGVPPVVGPKVIRKSVDDQLRGLAAEMNRRGDAVAPGNPS